MLSKFLSYLGKWFARLWESDYNCPKCHGPADAPSGVCKYCEFCGAMEKNIMRSPINYDREVEGVK